MSDNIDHPSHYRSLPAKCNKCGNSIECIEIVRHMNFSLGNTVKYIWRANHKKNTIEDLKKAKWYLEDEIARLELEKKTINSKIYIEYRDNI